MRFLWFLLAGLLVLLIWALAWAFAWNTALPVLLTLVVLGVFALVWGVQKLLARRAARKIEAQILGTDAKKAAPSPEVVALQKVLDEGLKTLKAARRGRGGGPADLEQLPFYVIVGPPGAGKTTALKHSGLLVQNQETGMRGVGGTRNCDWWFTNEAVLLDTAGRYSVEQDDREEWLAFLQFLAKHRKVRPIDGIIVAVSVADLADADPERIEAIGKNLRARIDEVILELKMMVPIYVLFTKVDLVEGFTEFFADAKRSDRTNIWGATLRVDAPRNEPGRLFASEFDVLVSRAHGKALRRLVTERSRDAREAVFRFPIELAELKKNLADLIDVTFAPNSFQTTPLFRGFYFTSGTQEGQPSARVLDRMSAAMGMKRAHNTQVRLEPKSYFLHDLFAKVIFKDRDVGSRSPGEVRRQALAKLGIAAATTALAAVVALPSYASYKQNEAFLDKSERDTKIAAAIKWDDNKPLHEKPALLVPTRRLLQEHDRLKEEGVPASMGFGMYKADKVYKPTLKVYARQMVTGFVKPSKRRLEQQLETADPRNYLATRALLKQYLMLREVDHIDVDWATGRWTKLWADAMADKSDVSKAELIDAMKGNIAYYFQLLAEKKVKPEVLDDGLIERVRRALLSVPIDQRDYFIVVESLNDELVDETKERDVQNLLFPPVRLDFVFPDLGVVQRHFRSKKQIAGKGYETVEGPYTFKGWFAVVERMKGAKEMLRSEAWVVPLGADETSDKIDKRILALKNRYETRYIESWEAFFSDILVTSPKTVDEALELWTSIDNPPLNPHNRLVEVLETHTVWRNENPFLANDAVRKEANRKFNQKLNMYTAGIVVNFDAVGWLEKNDRVPTAFAGTIAFKEQPKNKTATNVDSKIFQYIQIVHTLRQRLESLKLKYGGGTSLYQLNDDLVAANQALDALLRGSDERAIALMAPLMKRPLTISPP